MRRLKIIARLAIACFVLVAVLWQINKMSTTVDRRARHGETLVGSPLKDVIRIDIEFANAKQVSLEADAGGWSIIGPRSMRASEPAVMELLDTLEFARRDDFIDSDEMELRGLTLENFGLAPTPFGTIRVVGRHFDLKLVAGDCDPLTNGFFVALEPPGGRIGGVFVTDASLRSVFLKSPEDFADRRVFQCNLSLVHTVILRRPSGGDIKLLRAGRHQWKITQPYEARADWNAVGRLFDILAAATVEGEYLADAPSARTSLDKAGSASIVLFSQDDFAGRTLFIGDSVSGGGDLAYAQYPDGGAITVTGALRRAILLSDARDFLDRSLFPPAKSTAVKAISVESAGHHLSLRCTGKGGWSFAAPVSSAAEPGKVAPMIDGILSLKAEELAPFDQSASGPRIAAATVDLASGRVAFDIYNAPSGVPDRLGLLPEGSPSLFVVPGATVSNLLALCTDPLPLLSRTVASVKEDDVRAVTVARPGAFEERIVRSAGEWAAAEAGRAVDEVSVRSFFSAAALVRAETVAALAPTNSMPSEGFAEIAFDMADGASLRRIITIGPRTSGGHYARVKGHDTVFLISPETASALASPLLIPEVAAPAGESATPPPAGKDNP